MTTLEQYPIVNLDGYNRSMSLSLADKLFFMSCLDSSVKLIFDYGCADGALIHFLAEKYPDIHFWGYDKNKEMIMKARQGIKSNNEHFTFDQKDYDQWCDSHPEITWRTNLALNMSSVIHEIYSYSRNVIPIYEFWEDVTSGSYKYVCIRDMCIDPSAHRPAWKEDVLKIRRNFPTDKLQQFESISGSIDNQYSLIHFLLKYRYIDNWEREVHENYSPLTPEQITSHFDPKKYELIYYEHYTLPYLVTRVKNDFDITLTDPTHIKLIYRRKDR